MASEARRLRWEREKSTWPHAELSHFGVAGGLQWHVQRAGHGPRLLLLHGTGASTHSWRDLMAPLAARFTVLAPDLPGHGFTESPSSSRFSIDGMSASLDALLQSLDFAPECCVGHSAGAVLLCRMALARTIQPRVIVSLNGAFLPLASTWGKMFAPLAKLLASSPLAPRLLSWQGSDPGNIARILASTGSQLSAQGIEYYRRLVANPDHVAGALAMMSNWDLEAMQPRLPELTAPLVLMVGSNDRTVPAPQALVTQRRVRHAQVVTLPGLGHLAHEEAPAQVAERIIEVFEAARVEEAHA